MSESALIESLHQLRRRVRVLGVFLGVGVVLAAVVGGLILSILIDFALHLPAQLRFLLLAAGTAAAGSAAYRLIVRPLLSRLSLSDIAGRVEQAYPQFDDRLRSTVAYIDHEVPGSDLMKRRTIHEATQLAGTVDLRNAIVTRPVWYATSAAAAALLLALLLSVVVDPNLARIGLGRLLAPFSELTWPKRTQIDLIDAVPSRVPLGQRIDMKMRLLKGSTGKATLVYQLDGGAVQRQLMTRAPDGTFSTALDARTGNTEGGSIIAWIEAGDDKLDLGLITVVPRLAIRKVLAVVTPPAYAKLPAVSADLSAGAASVSIGAGIELQVQFNKPLDVSKPIDLEPVGEADKPVPAAESSGNDAILRWTAGKSARFRIHATDQDGFSNNALEEYEIIVQPDQTPVVQIENPRRNEERTAVSVVPLVGVAEDDYAIESLALVVERLGENAQQWQIPFVQATQVVEPVKWVPIESAGQRHRFRATYAWDLSKLENANLKAGDVLEYHLVGTDNFNLDGVRHSPVLSGKLRITIITQEDLTAKVIDELRTVARNANEIRNNQTRTREETESLKAETEGKPQLDEADQQAASRLAQEQSAAASQAKQISTKLDELLDRLKENRSDNDDIKDLTRDARDTTTNAAEEPMRKAAGELSSARDAKDDPKDRSEKFDRATREQKEAEAQLQKAIDRMGGIGSLAKTIEDVRNLLNEQKRLGKESEAVMKKNLGKTPEQMSPEDREQLDKLEKEQEDFSDKTSKAIDEMAKAAKQMEKTDPDSSASLKDAAKTAQQQQVPQQQKKASDSMKQNQKRNTENAQKQAELGLQMVLDQLKQAERRKLESLSKKLEELEKQIQTLIRRQAGHNLDTLGQQGQDKLAKLSKDQIEKLIEQAERQAAKPMEIDDLASLTAAQRQTESNTRDLGKGSQEVQGGAAASAHLTRAASRMERALVHLRDKKLADAHDPLQIEALAALEEAIRVVREEKNKVDEKIEEQQRDTIRAALEKVRGEQDKLNQKVVKIDKSPRGDDGALKRDAAVRLGKLPGEQGGLGDTMNKIAEDLRGLGGVVYVWTAEDVAGAMAAVKELLGTLQVGAATQSEQVRIVAVLDSMIKNLEQKPPPEKKFEKPKGGGGGGGGGEQPPKLPGAAELKLMRDLQSGVNASTKALDAAKEKDNAALEAAGARQGALRDLLDQLLKNASDGELALGDEPDNKDQLPEEANVEDVENQELDDELLGGEPKAEKMEKDVRLVGTRMARSKQRLADNHDSGKATQLIQDRIVLNIEQLIKEAENQEGGSGQAGGKAGKKGQPKPGEGEQPDNQQADGGQKPQPGVKDPGGTDGAKESLTPPKGTAVATSEEIVEKMSEWGGVTPRLRDAVIEGASETIIEKYKKLIDDYYKTLATEGSRQ